MIIAFYIIPLLITFSVLGYGFLLIRTLNFKNDILNFGLLGILGLFSLSIISSLSHFFFPHNYIHNILLIIFGLIFLAVFGKNNKQILVKYLKFLLIIFTLLFIAFVLSKTNEDYSYYHLPNSLQFSQQKLQFGLGNLNHGFKHISSLFMLKSINYLPFFNHYFFNLTNFIFLVFFIQFAVIEIYYRRKFNYNFSQILLFFFLILYLVKFSRIAEYGTDLSGQILIAMYLFFISEVIFNNKLKKDHKIKYFIILLILLIFAITTKFILSIYSLFLLLSFILIKDKIEILKKILNSKNLIILSLPIIFFLFFNFSSTGCVLYPLKFTCFGDKFSWALSEDTVDNLNFIYELWSKGGMGPNFAVENQELYINSLNWVSNWFSNYFISKISDYILVCFLIILIFSSFFTKELFLSKSILKIKNLKPYFLFYIVTILVFLLWFFNFPSLRYSGYIVVFILLVYPFICFFNSRIIFSKKNVIKKISIIFLISYTVFFMKNLNRLNNELNISISSHHNFNNFPFYWVPKTEFEEVLINGHKVFKTSGKCWDIPSTCVRMTDSLKINKYNNYIFYSLR